MAQKKTILCVDDEASILKSLERCLLLADYAVLKAGSGMEGLQVLAGCQGAVDLIIIDQRMPQMTGDEFLHRVKELYGRRTSIMLSGHADVGGLERAINDGEIFKFVTKPWDNDALIATIKSAIELGAKQS